MHDHAAESAKRQAGNEQGDVPQRSTEQVRNPSQSTRPLAIS
jgi:hypothetical protein